MDLAVGELSKIHGKLTENLYYKRQAGNIAAYNAVDALLDVIDPLEEGPEK